MTTVEGTRTTLHPLPRLSNATLRQARAGVALPPYDRGRLRSGIVHLGLGAFARAHLAAYTDALLAIAPGDWGIIGASLQNPGQRDRLAPQDGLYTAIQRDGGKTGVRIIGCVLDILVAPEDPAALIAAMARATTHIVSLTVTEKGYCHDPATGRLDQHHPDIRHDLDHPGAPRSAIGLIVAALRARRASGLAPFTVVCCDNLPHNGRLVAGLVGDFAARHDDRLKAPFEAERIDAQPLRERLKPGLARRKHRLGHCVADLKHVAPGAKAVEGAQESIEACDMARLRAIYECSHTGKIHLRRLHADGSREMLEREIGQPTETAAMSGDRTE